MDRRAGLDDMEKWKFFALPGLELPLSLVVQPVASRYTDWAVSALSDVRKAIYIFVECEPRKGERKVSQREWHADVHTVQITSKIELVVNIRKGIDTL
jgi:hypothetical protein